MATEQPQQNPFSPIPGVFDDALAAGSALSQPRSITVPADSSKPYQVLPKGYEVKDLERLLPTPQRRTGTIVLLDVNAFAQAINDYQGEDTRLYGIKPRVERGKATAEPTMTAVFDDHAGGSPGWGQFRAHYSMPMSFEWAEWSSRNGNQMSQDVFAQFMEDRYLDVIEPSAADMLEISRSISAVRNATFKKAIHLHSGSNQFAYEDTTQAAAGASGTVTVPEEFKIAIPVFQGGQRFGVRARLRYRLDNNGRLSLWFDLIEPHRVVEEAVNDVWKLVSEEVGLTIIHGVPAEARK